MRRGAFAATAGLLVVALTGCASVSGKRAMVQPYSGEAEYFRRQPPGLSRFQRQRLFLAKRLSEARGLWSIGPGPIAPPQVTDYCQLSGAVAEAARMKKALATLGILTGAHGSVQSLPAPHAGLTAALGLGHEVMAMGVGANAYEDFKEAARSFNRRLAAALDLREGLEADTGLGPAFPPSLAQAGPRDLYSGETAEDLEKAYLLVKAGPDIYLGIRSLGRDELAAYYDSQGASQAALAERPTFSDRARNWLGATGAVAGLAGVGGLLYILATDPNQGNNPNFNWVGVCLLAGAAIMPIVLAWQYLQRPRSARDARMTEFNRWAKGRIRELVVGSR